MNSFFGLLLIWNLIHLIKYKEILEELNKLSNENEELKEEMKSKNIEVEFQAFEEFMINILSDGGLVKHYLKEKEYLNSEPNYDALEDYYTSKPIARKVDSSSLVQFKLKRYSVPSNYIGKLVTVVENNEQISIYYNNNLICTHKILWNFLILNTFRNWK